MAAKGKPKGKLPPRTENAEDASRYLGALLLIIVAAYSVAVIRSTGASGVLRASPPKTFDGSQASASRALDGSLVAAVSVARGEDSETALIARPMCSTGGVALSWNLIPERDEYVIFRCDAPACAPDEFASIRRVFERTFEDDNVAEGRAFRYRVHANDLDGIRESVFSNIAEITYACEESVSASRAPKPSVSIVAERAYVPRGAGTRLYYSSVMLDECTVAGPDGLVATGRGTSAEGIPTPPILFPSTFIVTCAGDAGIASDSVTIHLEQKIYEEN